MKSRYNRNCTKKPYSSKYSHFGEIGCYIRDYLSPSAENMYYLHLNILPFLAVFMSPPASLSFSPFPSFFTELNHLHSLLYFSLLFIPIRFELFASYNYALDDVHASNNIEKNTPTIK